jgi:hypothetical protein
MKKVNNLFVSMRLKKVLQDKKLLKKHLSERKFNDFLLFF